VKVVSSKTIHLENAKESSKLYEIVHTWQEQEIDKEFSDHEGIRFAEELLSALIAYGDH